MLVGAEAAGTDRLVGRLLPVADSRLLDVLVRL
jgi:hypothetical protein